ncbi:MAG: hypothetical protein C0497_05460 [Gemmatimonas sp.]|nr:hypothetical protein [Gemmatimonas sp.]
MRHLTAPSWPEAGTSHFRFRSTVHLKARRERRVIACVDETGHSFRARLNATWAPRGHTPVLCRLSKRRDISSIIAVTPAGRLTAWHVDGSVKGPDTCRALRHFRRVLARPLLVLWDRGAAHTAHVVQEFVATHPRDYATATLLADAPELNPEEQANAIIKRRMANACPDSVPALKAPVVASATCNDTPRPSVISLRLQGWPWLRTIVKAIARIQVRGGRRISGEDPQQRMQVGVRDKHRVLVIGS